MSLWNGNTDFNLIPGKLKIEFFSQETYDFQILGNETLIIACYKDIKIVIFHSLAVKLWLKEDDDLLTNNLRHSSKYIHSKVQTFHKIVLPLSHNFAANQSNAEFLHLCDQR